MFGRSRPVYIDSFNRRSKARVPRWLILLASGMAIGAAAVIVVQQRYLPPRLSAAESAALRSSAEQARSDRQELRAKLDQATQQIETLSSQREALDQRLSTSLADTKRLRGDLGSLIAALPPDPRGGQVEVRAGQLAADDGTLNYEVVLTRQRGDGPPLTGMLQLVVDGTTARGTPSAVTLEPKALQLRQHLVVRGEAALPAGFKPRQAQIRIVDEATRLLGMRVLLVQ